MVREKNSLNLFFYFLFFAWEEEEEEEEVHLLLNSVVDVCVWSRLIFRNNGM